MSPRLLNSQNLESSYSFFIDFYWFYWLTFRTLLDMFHKMPVYRDFLLEKSVFLHRQHCPRETTHNRCSSEFGQQLSFFYRSRTKDPKVIWWLAFSLQRYMKILYDKTSVEITFTQIANSLRCKGKGGKKKRKPSYFQSWKWHQNPFLKLANQKNLRNTVCLFF